MADEQTAETLATDTTESAAPVNDGIIDLDAAEQVTGETSDDEDGQTDEAKAAKAAETAETEKKKLSGAQRAKIREARLLNENADLQRRLEQATKTAPAAKAGESDDKPPREEDFNGDFFAFQTAKTAYEAGKAAKNAVDQVFKSREETERATNQTKATQERREAHLERVEDAREIIADFDQVMKGMDGVQVRTDVIDEIMSSDKSAEISYFLAKNPDKLDAMNRMSARELAREMGRLEATVQLPEAKKATTAPAPPRRQQGGASPSSAESDLAAWVKKTYG